MNSKNNQNIHSNLTNNGIDSDTIIRTGSSENLRFITVLARGTAIPTSGRTTVSPINTPYTFPPSASQMTISSSSANDTVAGTGGRVVLVQYLDDNYNEQTEIVLTNGQTGVNTVATNILRVNRMIVVNTGSLGFTDGDIYIGTGTITAGVPANIYHAVDTNETISNYGVYTVPAGWTLYTRQFSVGVESGKSVRFLFGVRAFGGNTFMESGALVVSDNLITDIKTTSGLGEKSDIKVVGTTLSGSAATADFNWTALLHKNGTSVSEWR